MRTTTAPLTAARGPAPTLYAHVDSPLGRLLLVGRGDALTGLYLVDHGRPAGPLPGWREARRAFSDVEQQLGEYFAGERAAFGVRVELTGTPFQLRVWSALRGIPYGQTITYGELARRIGSPGAARAVGLANGRNPVSIIVPCHRVVAAGGKLGGYGWGTERKAWLLDLEHRRQAQQPSDVQPDAVDGVLRSSPSS